MRSRATLLLADVLHQLPTESFNKQEVELLRTFLCEKLEDHFTIQPHAVAGLLALSYQSCLPVDSVHGICRSIFRYLHTQSLSQGHRMNVYTLFLNFLHNYLSAVREMGADFTCGFIQAMEGEKDPRNLLLAFRCASLISAHVPLGTFTEELFDVVSCYFPIDFHPPPTDTSGITKDLLVTALRDCLSSTPKFALFCLPLLLEKIDSDIQNARLDAFATLAACAPTYGPQNLKSHLKSLLSSIKKEVYNRESPSLAASALSALTSIIQTLTAATQQISEDGASDKFLEDIVIECRANITDAMSSLLYPSCQILEAAMATAPTASSKIIHAVVPLVIHKLNENLQADERVKVTEVLVRLMDAAAEFNQSQDVISAWSKLNADLYKILVSGCQSHDVALNLVSLRATCRLIDLGRLSTGDLENLSGELLEVFNKKDKDIRSQTLECLRKISEKSPDLTRRHILPQLQTHLCSDSDTDTLLHTIDTIAAVCKQSDVIHLALLSLIDLIASDGGDVRHHTVKTLGGMLAANVDKRDVVNWYNDEILPPILLMYTNHERPIHQPSLDHVGNILRLLVTHLDTDKSHKLCQKIHDLTMSRDGFVEMAGDSGETEKADCATVEEGDNDKDDNVSVLLVYTFAACHPDDVKDLPGFMDQLFAGALTSTRPSICLSYSKLYSSFLNKMQTGSRLDERLSEIAAKLTTPSDIGACLTGHNAVILWSWVTKALVIRAHPLAEEFTDRIIACLSHEYLGRVAADGFGTIVRDDSVVLNKQSHAVIKYLHKQRIFQENIAKITEAFGKCSENCRSNYLLALSHLLQSVPQASLQPYMPQLLPMLLQSLAMDEPILLLQSLTTLSQIQTADAAVSHADSLVTKLLLLSHYEASMMVRLKAVECLTSLSRLPYPSIHPSQKVVIKTLQTALNDRKRLVREAAAKARRKWYLLGSS